MKLAPVTARRLAACQMALGAFIMLTAGYAALCGFPTQRIMPTSGPNIMVLQSWMPAPPAALAHYLVMLAVPVGLAVLLLGLAQLRRARE